MERVVAAVIISGAFAAGSFDTGSKFEDLDLTLRSCSIATIWWAD